MPEHGLPFGGPGKGGGGAALTLLWARSILQPGRADRGHSRTAAARGKQAPGPCLTKGAHGLAHDNDDARTEAVTRLRRIEGQIRGLQRMIEEGQDCDAVLTQLMAARAALDSVGLFIVRPYLDECLRGTGDPRLRERLQRVIELFLRYGLSGVAGERSTGDGCGTGGCD